MTWAVVDTNVLAVANGAHAEAEVTCEQACINELTRVRNEGIVVDEGGEIFAQYDRNASRRGQPGVGDAFWRWVWDNQANESVCRQVTVPRGDDDEYVDFPNDPELSRFDRSDRVFVAVALSSHLAPEILNASDTDWWYHREALARQGLKVRFLCPELMERPTRRTRAPKPSRRQEVSRRSR